MVKRIAIIPARGGSKRIPQKNIIPFEGKPMIAWTIEAALNSNLFDKVVVSTDSSEIAEVALVAGAQVPFLREDSNDDFAAVSEATVNALRQAEAHWGTRFDQVVQLMANCPLRNANHVRESLHHFEASEANFQISCFRYGWMNPWWAVRLGEDGEPSRLFKETEKQRSQDLDSLYCPTGAIWIAERAALLKANSFYGPDHRFFPIDWRAAVDIDDMDDLAMAAAIAHMQQSGA